MMNTVLGDIMIQHFLASFLKNTSPSQLYIIPIPTRDCPIVDLLPIEAYAYFICDIDVTMEDDLLIPLSTPQNCSHTTYLGGTIYPMKLALEVYEEDNEMIEFLSSWNAKHVIIFENLIFPFFDDDIQISI